MNPAWHASHSTAESFTYTMSARVYVNGIAHKNPQREDFLLQVLLCRYGNQATFTPY